MKVKAFVYKFISFAIALFVGMAGFVVALVCLASVINFATNDIVAIMTIAITVVMYIAIVYVAKVLITRLLARAKTGAKTVDPKL